MDPITPQIAESLGPSLPSRTPSPLQVAQADPEDLESISALHREAGWPGAGVDGEVWAARREGQLVGSVQLIELERDLVLIDAVVVRTSARGKGIGTELIRIVLATRAAYWWLECRPERVAFYERLGFVSASEADVPSVIKARVGSNHARQQKFLHISTISRDVRIS